MTTFKNIYPKIFLVAICWLLLIACKKESGPCMDPVALNQGQDGNCLFLQEAIIGEWDVDNWEIAIWEANNSINRNVVDLSFFSLKYNFKLDASFEGSYEGSTPLSGTWKVEDANELSSIRKLILTYDRGLGINHVIVKAVSEQLFLPIGTTSPQIEEFQVISLDAQGKSFQLVGQDFNSLNNLVVEIKMRLL